MVRFILNNQLVNSDHVTGSTLLDYIRYYKRLVGTKIGCREGDCGACTILVGDFEKGELVYRSMTSCLMPLGNANGKHIVTVEGINLSAGPQGSVSRQGMKELTRVQQAMVETNGTQCGFCTIGFVMSLTGFVLNENTKDHDQAIAAIDGNICRCTGYKSIERAAVIISQNITGKPGRETIKWLVEQNFIPEYFIQIKSRLQQLKNSIEASFVNEAKMEDKLMIGGGTDLIVQKALAVKKTAVHHLLDKRHLQEINFENGQCHIGASVTVTAFAESELIQGYFPDLQRYIKLIASTPIRNMATMGGNLVNASPIGDMSILFLALDSNIVLNKNGITRTIKLRDFFKGYKQIDKEGDEIIEKIIFTPPQNNFFNFEKVSKRTHLDIASVNSACQIQLINDGVIDDIHISAGGVAPFPKYLTQTVSFLKGKKMTQDIFEQAIQIMNNEISPISDARGSETYKRLLLRQLFLAHFKNENEVIKKLLGI